MWYGDFLFAYLVKIVSEHFFVAPIYGHLGLCRPREARANILAELTEVLMGVPAQQRFVVDVSDPNTILCVCLA